VLYELGAYWKQVVIFGLILATVGLVLPLAGSYIPRGTPIGVGFILFGLAFIVLGLVSHWENISLKALMESEKERLPAYKRMTRKNQELAVVGMFVEGAIVWFANYPLIAPVSLGEMALPFFLVLLFVSAAWTKPERREIRQWEKQWKAEEVSRPTKVNSEKEEANPTSS
jgi:hypothetical protein